MLDFLNSLGKKIVSQPERVSTDTYSDAITGKVKDTVSDYVENFPIADPELYSKLPVGMVGSALSIPAETANLASYIPFSPYKPLRESGVLEPYRKDATLNFLFNLGSKLNPESTTFQRTGSPTEEYALGVLPDVLIGFGAPTITKIPSLAKKADDFIQTRTATDLGDITEALALAGQTRQSPLSLASMTGEASLGKTTFPRELDENYFFNKAYEISRNLDQEKGTPDQFRSMFEKGGVTKDEFRWSGLGEFLKEQKQANLPVTKQDVTDFLDENRMSVNIKDLTEEVDYDTQDELTFRVSTMDSDSSELADRMLFQQYVDESIENSLERIRYDVLQDDDTYYFNDIFDEIFDEKFDNNFLIEEKAELYVAYMKEYFDKTGKDVFSGNLNAIEYATDKTFKKINSSQRSINPERFEEILNSVPDFDEKAKTLIEKWENFNKNIVGFSPKLEAGSGSPTSYRLNYADNFPVRLSELMDNYDDARDLTDTALWESLNEEYPEITASEAFADPVALRDFQRSVFSAIEKRAKEEVEDQDIHEIAAYDQGGNLLYTAIGQRDLPYFTPDDRLELYDVYDQNVVQEAMNNTALEDGVIQYRSSELYEELTPPDVFGTRQAYNVNLYEDTSDLARKEFESSYKAAHPVLSNLGSGRFREMIPGNLQSHFYEYSNEFPIGHVRSTIRDLNGTGVEFKNDYLKIHNDYLEAQVDEQRRILEADDTPERRYDEVREAMQREIDSFYSVGEYEPLKLSSKAIKSSNLDGKVYAIHEIQSDVAQQLTSPRSSDMTPSGLEKAKKEARKAIGKNPESKMMEFDERAEAIRKRFIKFGEKYNAFNSKMFSDAPTYEKPKKTYDSDSINELFDNYAVARDLNDYYDIEKYFDFSNRHLPLLGKDDYIPYSLLRVKEEIAQDFRKLGKDIETYGDALKNLEKLEETNPTVMDAPYIQEKRGTTRIMLKGEIAKAVDADADYVTLGEPVFNRKRQGFTDAEEFYGVAVPKIAEKILKPLDPDIKLIDLDVGTGEVVKGFKITEKLKKALREQGQSYFAPFTAIGTGILGSQVAKEQENSYE